jgi:hypothetical protein
LGRLFPAWLVFDPLRRIRSSECPEIPKLELVASAQFYPPRQIERRHRHEYQTDRHGIGQQQPALQRRPLYGDIGINDSRRPAQRLRV